MKNKIKRMLHMLLGYKIKVTFPNGDTEIAKAYLSADLSIRVYLIGGRQCMLQADGVVRGLWPDDSVKWELHPCVKSA